MGKVRRASIVIGFGFLLPFLILMSPNWLRIFGIGPCWPVLWLLPWALESGPFSGILSGLFLGVLLDSISLNGYTQIPALILLGLWWGRLGSSDPKIERSFNLGLLAFLGSIFLSLFTLIQVLFHQALIPTFVFYNFGIQTLFSKSILTGLLAPMICSWIILFLRRRRIV